LNDKGACRTHIHDTIVAQFSGEDAWTKRPVSANIDSSEENNESHSGIIYKSGFLQRSAAFAANRYLRKLETMKRVVIIGRGASGKSTLARRLGDVTGLPVTEVDKIFWQPGLVATPRDQWVVMQEKLVAGDRWIMEGDLGPYDAVEVRLRSADTIIFLDFSLVRCAWRAIRRSRERADFWRWLLAYRYQSRPILREAIANHAPGAVLHVFRSPRALGRFVADAARFMRDVR
jgi:nicotinamide riboside kinase